MNWRLADRTLDLAQPLAAGIVNVTVDSMFEGARSGTPEQAVADGLALAEAGFDMLDVGAVAAKAGPPVPPEDEAAALVPAIEGLATNPVCSFPAHSNEKEQTNEGGCRPIRSRRRWPTRRSTRGRPSSTTSPGARRRCSGWSRMRAAATC